MPRLNYQVTDRRFTAKVKVRGLHTEQVYEVEQNLITTLVSKALAMGQHAFMNEHGTMHVLQVEVLELKEVE